MANMPPMMRSLYKLLVVFRFPSWSVFLTEFVVNSAHTGVLNKGIFSPLGKYIFLAQTEYKKAQYLAWA